MVATDNFFICQGSDFSATFDYPDATNGDVAQAQLRRWADGPLLATFDTTVDVEGRTVSIALSADVTAGLLRSGYYDVEVVNGLDTTPVAGGFAKLRYRVTTGPSSSSRRRWGLLKYSHATWGDLRKKRWKQL